MIMATPSVTSLHCLFSKSSKQSKDFWATQTPCQVAIGGVPPTLGQMGLVLIALRPSARYSLSLGYGLEWVDSWSDPWIGWRGAWLSSPSIWCSSSTSTSLCVSSQDVDKEYSPAASGMSL